MFPKLLNNKNSKIYGIVEDVLDMKSAETDYTSLIKKLN